MRFLSWCRYWLRRRTDRKFWGGRGVAVWGSRALSAIRAAAAAVAAAAAAASASTRGEMATELLAALSRSCDHRCRGGHGRVQVWLLLRRWRLGWRFVQLLLMVRLGLLALWLGLL